jgi:hypothetical protein
MIDMLIAARVLHFTATVALVGAVVFQLHVCAPILYSATDATGRHLVVRLTRWIWWIGLALAVASGAAWLLVLTAQITGDTIMETLSDAMTLLTQTQFGMGAGLRFVIAIALAGVLERCRSSGTLRWLALALCFTGSLAWTGHSGAGDGLEGDVQMMGRRVQ